MPCHQCTFEQFIAQCIKEKEELAKLRAAAKAKGQRYQRQATMEEMLAKHRKKQ